jgi:hypothetical protein
MPTCTTTSTRKSQAICFCSVKQKGSGTTSSASPLPATRPRQVDSRGQIWHHEDEVLLVVSLQQTSWARDVELACELGDLGAATGERVHANRPQRSAAARPAAAYAPRRSASSMP